MSNSLEYSKPHTNALALFPHHVSELNVFSHSYQYDSSFFCYKVIYPCGYSALCFRAFGEKAEGVGATF